jgi:hypothetical protein
MGIYMRTRAHYMYKQAKGLDFSEIINVRDGIEVTIRLLIVGSNISSNINNMQYQLSILLTWHAIN